MDENYIGRSSRGPNGSGRRARICSVRIPEEIKLRLDKWKAAYECRSGRSVSYENMLTWWMDNIGRRGGLWDCDISRAVEQDYRLNFFFSKDDIVSYLNRTGKFWEYCNKASASLSDEEVITKALLFLEFEDMPQLFSLFGFERCREVFLKNIKLKGDYYENISFLLETLFFRYGKV